MRSFRGLLLAFSSAVGMMISRRRWYWADGRQGMREIFKHNFGDGKGEVDAYRHANPDGSVGGVVACTATVAATARVSDRAWVSGGAVVSGGAWVESPPYMQIGRYGGMYVIDRCLVKIAIGCQVHSVAHWQVHLDEIADEAGATSQEHAMAAVFVEMCADFEAAGLGFGGAP